MKYFTKFMREGYLVTFHKLKKYIDFNLFFKLKKILQRYQVTLSHKFCETLTLCNFFRFLIFKSDASLSFQQRGKECFVMLTLMASLLKFQSRVGINETSIHHHRTRTKDIRFDAAVIRSSGIIRTGIFSTSCSPKFNYETIEIKKKKLSP